MRSMSVIVLVALLWFPNLGVHLGSGLNLTPASVLCFKTGEQTSGMNKICYYNCLGSAAAITIPAT